MRMFRDFHVIDGKGRSYLFFPESFKLYSLSLEDGEMLRLFRDKGAPITDEIKAILLEEERKAEAGKIPAPHEEPETDSLCLYMAHDCNLSCTYCYNDRGRSANPSMMMSEDIVEAAFRRFFTAPGREYAVSFYGGEPLLNFGAIRRAVEIGDALGKERGITISYSMTTNGTVLTEEMAGFIESRISNVCVSIDGDKDTHDLHRKWGHGSSYDAALRNLKRLKKGAGRVTLQATVSGDAVKRLDQTVSHLSTLPSDGFSVSYANTGRSNPAHISDERFEEFIERFTGLTGRHFHELIDGSGHGFKYTFNIVFNLLTKRRFFRYCDAGKNPAVTADGSMYACHGLVGMKEFYMGNVMDETDPPQYREAKETFASLTVCEIDECKGCWARYLCGGSCYAHAYINTGNLFRPDPRHCKLFKRNAEVVIAEFLSAMDDPEKREMIYSNIKKAARPGRGDGCGE